MTHTDRPAPPAYTSDVLPRVGPRLLPRGATRCPDCDRALVFFGVDRLSAACPNRDGDGCGKAFGVALEPPTPATDA